MPSKTVDEVEQTYVISRIVHYTVASLGVSRGGCCLEQLQLSLREPGQKRRRRAPARLKDPAFAEAMRDARAIREWTDGPNPASARVYRLAQALMGERAQ